jgi:hypothetical protein
MQQPSPPKPIQLDNLTLEQLVVNIAAEVNSMSANVGRIERVVESLVQNHSNDQRIVELEKWRVAQEAQNEYYERKFQTFLTLIGVLVPLVAGIGGLIVWIANHWK